MDFEELNTFLEVIRTQSLVAAARHLHVTPSTVTARRDRVAARDGGRLQRWLDMGLIDIAFCYIPHAGEQYTSRSLFEDQLILVSGHADQSAALDSSYIYVDHGDQVRRQQAEAFPEARPSPVYEAAVSALSAQ